MVVGLVFSLLFFLLRSYRYHKHLFLLSRKCQQLFNPNLYMIQEVTPGKSTTMAYFCYLLLSTNIEGLCLGRKYSFLFESFFKAPPHRSSDLHILICPKILKKKLAALTLV